MSKPRILVCFGEGPEIIGIIAASQQIQQKADFVWWCKNEKAYRTLKKYINNSHYFCSIVKRPHPVHNNIVLNNMIPSTWIEQTISYEQRRAERQEREICETDKVYVAALLSEAVRVISLLRPNAVLIRGATRPQEASFKTVACELGVPHLFVERGAFPDSVFLDPNSTYSEMLRTLPEDTPISEAQEATWQARSAFLRNYLQTERSAWDQPPKIGEQALYSKLGISRKDRIFFYVAQVEDDANMLLHSPYFLTNIDFLKHVASSIQGLRNVVLVVKPHPKEPKEIPDLSAEYGIHMIIRRDINIKDILPLASVVVTINSTVGFEALLYNKPVVVGGKAHYSHRGFTFDVTQSDGMTSSQKLREFLDNPVFSSDQQRRKDRYVEALLHHSLYFLNPEPGLNGPDDFVGKLLDVAGPADYLIPLKLIEASERFLTAYGRASCLGSFTYGSLLRHVLRRGVWRASRELRSRLSKEIKSSGSG